MDQSCTKLSNTYYGLEKYELQSFSFAKKLGKWLSVILPCVVAHIDVHTSPPPGPLL
jgi:hypothetical protein